MLSTMKSSLDFSRKYWRDSLLRSVHAHEACSLDRDKEEPGIEIESTARTDSWDDLLLPRPRGGEGFYIRLK